MNTRKLLTMVLALLVAMSMLCALAEKELPSGQNVVVKTEKQDLKGKTVILHSNDVHGSIEGYACIAQAAKDYRARGADVIMVDDGDFSQGEIYVSLSKGRNAVEMMNAAGYDVVTLGNHEFDFGCDQLLENMKDAKFQVICANVTRDGKPLFPGTTVIETEAGMKIGFFGMETPETASKVNPPMIKGLSFSNSESLYTTAQEAVDSLREQGVDLVIGLWHLGIDDESAVNGYRSTDLMSRVTGVDFVIDGHSHTIMTEDESGNPIQSTGTRFAFVGVVIISNDTRTVEDHFLLDARYLGRDEEVAAAASAIIDAVDKEYGAPFATCEVELNGERDPGNRTEETNMGDLICDSMVWCVTREGGLEQENTGVVGICSGGGIRASIRAGDISRKDVTNVQPFNNTVVVIYVTGAELLEALEASTFATPSAIGGFPQTSGIVWTLDTSIPYDAGELYISADGKETIYYAPKSIRRVTVQSINGQPFDPAATYAVATNNFCAAGGDTYNAFYRAYNEGTGFDTGLLVDQVMMDYIAEALDGVVTAEAYGQPRGSLTIK